jgi:hypothetical protein
MKESQSYHKDFNGVPMSLTIIPYTNSCVIAVGPKGLLGFMHESACTNLAVSPITHRVLLGDRDDLVAPIFCQQLGDRMLQMLRTQRVVVISSVGREMLIEAETMKQITGWVVESVQISLRD